MPRKRPQLPVPVRLHPEAEEELDELGAATVADVAFWLSDLDGKTHQELVVRLDERTERKICQLEKSHKEGTLRVVFAWGTGCLWFIGAFVKRNDREGERYMKRILPRGREVEKWGVTK